jgi:glutamine amidotransferase
MCRLVGVVASEATNFHFTLQEAPRSLAALSPDHPDGWGLAVHERSRGWEVHKQAVCAKTDLSFRSLAASSQGELLIAHVRKRTVGPIGPTNTHPFRRDRWVFAHNGTIEDQGWLAARISAARGAEIEGDTDSELFFAALLSAIDAAGPTACRAQLDRAIVDTVRACHARADLGSSNFLLCDGQSLYAHRSGRSLYRLARGQGDDVLATRRSSETSAVVETRWSERRVAILIASERLTDEPWVEIPDGTLLRVDAGSCPAVETLCESTVRPSAPATTCS